jgi:hypothetical protein
MKSSDSSDNECTPIILTQIFSLLNDSLGINALMALEAFVGVLFSSIVAAILVGKIARVQSIAPVTFSHPICVRYGTGVALEDDDNDSDSDNEDSNDGVAKANEKGEDDVDRKDGGQKASPRTWPCPVLEFRLINDLAAVVGGEVIDAKVACVASTLEEPDEAEQRLSLRRSRAGNNRRASLTMNVMKNAGTKGTKAAKMVGQTGTKIAKTTGAALFGAGKRATTLSGTVIQQLNQYVARSPKHGKMVIPENDTIEVEPYSENEFDSDLERELEDALAKRFAEQLEEERAIVNIERNQVTVDEGNTKLAPRRVYHKIEVSS